MDVWLALPPGDAPALIDSVLDGPATILELGSGPGRITHPLVAMGHRVTAVDESPDMLAHVTGAETVPADLYALDLGREFAAVVAASHLIDSPDPGRRRALLEVCGRHVAPSGVVLVERYDPEWAAAPTPRAARVGPVEVVFEPLGVEPGRFRGRVTYTLGDRRWVQEFEAAAVTDATLQVDAAAAGLEPAGWLDADRTWARLRRPATRAAHLRAATPATTA